MAAMAWPQDICARAAEIDTDLGGFVKFQNAWLTPGRPPTGSDGARLDGEIHLEMSSETDTGVTYGGRLQLLPAAKARDNGSFVQAGWAWGEFRLGDYGGAAKELSVSAPTIGIGQIDGDIDRFGGPSALIAPYALDNDDSTRLTYLSPAILGYRVGLSYAPEFASGGVEIVPAQHIPGIDRHRNVVEVALSSARDIGEVTVTTGAVFVTGSAEAGSHLHDLDGGSLGSKLAWNGLTVGGAFVYDGGDTLPLDRRPGHVGIESVISEINFGATYEVGRWGFGVSWARDYRKALPSSDIVAVGAVYKILDGVTLGADLAHYGQPREVGEMLWTTAVVTEAAVHF